VAKSTRVATTLGSGPLAPRPSNSSGDGRKFRNIRLFAAALILSVIGANVAAASLGLSGTGSLGVGVQNITACDTDGFTIQPISEYNTGSTAFVATGIALGSMASACDGKKLTLIVGYTNGGSAATSQITASSVNTTGMTLSVNLPSEQIQRIVVQISD